MATKITIFDHKQPIHVYINVAYDINIHDGCTQVTFRAAHEANPDDDLSSFIIAHTNQYYLIENYRLKEDELVEDELQSLYSDGILIVNEPRFTVHVATHTPAELEQFEKTLPPKYPKEKATKTFVFSETGSIHDDEILADMDLPYGGGSKSDIVKKDVVITDNQPVDNEELAKKIRELKERASIAMTKV